MASDGRSTVHIFLVSPCLWSSSVSFPGSTRSEEWSRQTMTEALSSAIAGDVVLLPRMEHGPLAWLREVAYDRSLKVVEFHADGSRLVNGKTSGPWEWPTRFTRADGFNRANARLYALIVAGLQALRSGWRARLVVASAPWRSVGAVGQFVDVASSRGIEVEQFECPREFAPSRLESLAEPKQRRAGRRVRRGRNGFVYFAESVNGMVKIGWSRDVARRCRALQSMQGQSVTIVVAAPGTTADEREMHATFSEYRQLGEWFVRGERLDAAIKTLSERFARGPLMTSDLYEAAR